MLSRWHGHSRLAGVVVAVSELTLSELIVGTHMELAKAIAEAGDLFHAATGFRGNTALLPHGYYFPRGCEISGYKLGWYWPTEGADHDERGLPIVIIAVLP